MEFFFFFFEKVTDITGRFITSPMLYLFIVLDEDDGPAAIGGHRLPRSLGERKRPPPALSALHCVVGHTGLLLFPTS